MGEIRTHGLQRDARRAAARARNAPTPAVPRAGTNVALTKLMTTPSSQVVVGFDFSHSGHTALQRAIDRAVQDPLQVLHVVCVIEPRTPIPAVPTTTGVDYQYAESVQQATTREIEHKLHGASTSNRVHFCVHARIGKPAEEILFVARDVGADLVIVGQKPATALGHLLLGSVSEQVAREAGCTVEIARTKLYSHVELATMVKVEPHQTYVPPHRYTYENRSAILRPNDWPLC